MLSKVRIVGSGLIGTSIALSLQAADIDIELVDIDSDAAALAMDLCGGVRIHSPELVLFALPSAALPLVIDNEYALNPNSTFMDVGSVKSEPILDVKRSKLPIAQFVPTHPMAGREAGGARSARGDLFNNRSWILTPTHDCALESIALVKELIEKTGANWVQLDAMEHDKAVAVISHMPQVVASLLGGALVDVQPLWLELSGAGLRDTTRIAASDPDLWREIIYSNREEIATLAKRMQAKLTDFIDGLDDKSKIESFIEMGRLGRSRIPGKHGGRAREYTYLPIVIEDKPGQLAKIFNECGAIGVNVEDLTIEHSPGQLSALITLALDQSDALSLSAHLSAMGWNVHPIVK